MVTPSSKARRWNNVKSKQVLGAVAVALLIAIPFFLFSSSFIRPPPPRVHSTGGGSSVNRYDYVDGGDGGGAVASGGPFLRRPIMDLHGDDSKILVCSGPPTRGLIMLRDPTQRALSSLKSSGSEDSTAMTESLVHDVTAKLQSCYNQLVADIDFRLKKNKGDRQLAHAIDECLDEASTSDLHQVLFDAVYLPQMLRYYEVFREEDLLILRAEDLEAKPTEVVAAAEEHMSPCRYSLQHKPLVFPDQDLSQEGHSQLYEALIPWNLKLYDYLGKDLGWPRYEEALVRVLINGDHPVVIFSKSYCGYSRKAKSIILDEMKVEGAVVVELDLHPRGSAIQTYLAQLTGRRTVPNVFIGGKSIGGGDDTAAAKESGKLLEWLIAAKALPEPPPAPPALTPVTGEDEGDKDYKPGGEEGVMVVKEDPPVPLLPSDRI